jgi:AcrR family transcriptional regulator
MRKAAKLTPATRASRREALLQGALTVIRREGPDASMDSMAAEAGITKPILYRHFGDRDGLVAAVANRFADELVRRLSRALDSQADQRRRIEAALRSYVDFIEEDPSLYGFLTREVQVASPVLVGVVDRVAVVLSAAIGDTMREAGLDSRPAETWAYGVVGMVHLAGARWAAHPSGPKDQFVHDLVQLVADGLIGSAAVTAVAAGAPEARR